MTPEKIEEIVAAYIDGDVAGFEKWLKKASKKDILVTVQILSWYAGTRKGHDPVVRGYEAAIQIMHTLLS